MTTQSANSTANAAAAKAPTGRTGITVLKKYFGFQEGQDLKGFAAEVKALDDKSFEQLRDGIENGTFDYAV